MSNRYSSVQRPRFLPARMQRDNKYNAQPTYVNGKRFASKKEADRYVELLWLLKAGEIRDLKCQVKFVLIPAQYELDEEGKKGKLIERAVNYFADFTYIDQDGEYIVEDTKGERTDVYIIKRKLLLSIHGIRIREI